MFGTDKVKISLDFLREGNISNDIYNNLKLADVPGLERILKLDLTHTVNLISGVKAQMDSIPPTK